MVTRLGLHKLANVIFGITQKSLLHAFTVLGYLQKLKRGLGLAFGAYFLHNFSIKTFLN